MQRRNFSSGGFRAPVECAKLIPTLVLKIMPYKFPVSPNWVVVLIVKACCVLFFLVQKKEIPLYSISYFIITCSSQNDQNHRDNFLVLDQRPQLVRNCCSSTWRELSESTTKLGREDYPTRTSLCRNENQVFVLRSQFLTGSLCLMPSTKSSVSYPVWTLCSMYHHKSLAKFMAKSAAIIIQKYARGMLVRFAMRRLKERVREQNYDSFLSIFWWFEFVTGVKTLCGMHNCFLCSFRSLWSTALDGTVLSSSTEVYWCAFRSAMASPDPQCPSLSSPATTSWTTKKVSESKETLRFQACMDL